MMKNLLLFGLLLAMLFSCELTSDPTEKVYVAEVVGYDLNCATCILLFPNDTAQINDLLGYSPFGYYHAVNLNMNDFAIGQLLEVKARQAMDTELRACIELYATYDYPYIYVTEYEQYRDSDFIDTLELNAGACVTTYGQANLCFDSVVNDSRCPIGAVCCWEGNAEVKLDLTITGQGKHEIKLNTHHNFPSDTTIGHLNISLLEVTPYPDLDREIKPEDYRVKLTVANLSMIEPNARVLSFNPDKCMCCWGWTIQLDSDTIKSDDVIIGETIGYEISEPIDVYLEPGAMDSTCSDMTGIGCYDIIRILKTQ